MAIMISIYYKIKKFLNIFLNTPLYFALICASIINIDSKITNFMLVLCVMKISYLEGENHGKH